MGPGRSCSSIEDVGDVPVHGPLADAKDKRDLLRPLAHGDVPQDFDLSPRASYRSLSLALV